MWTNWARLLKVQNFNDESILMTNLRSDREETTEKRSPEGAENQVKILGSYGRSADEEKN